MKAVLTTPPNNVPSSPWHVLDEQTVLTQLSTNPQVGLTASEAANRLAVHGQNKLTEAPRPTFLKLLINQLNNFIVILLIVASLVSAFLGDWIEAIAILLIVVLNAVLGIIQENRAEEALAALKRLAAPEAQVIRDGHRFNIPAFNLVPGDIVLLEAGNFVPADLRLLEAINLRIEEAALTGESVAVQKNVIPILEVNSALGDRKNTAFMGTLVSYGRGRGVVVASGMNTQLGMIAIMLQSVEEEDTQLQKRLDQLGKVLGWGALAICGLVCLIGIIRAHGSLQDIINMFMIAVSLAIAAVPEGLPAIVTISLALGMREMIRRHALIRRLSSVETLGSTTVICTDKTGTLTQNKMTVTQLWVDGHSFQVTGTGYDLEGDFLLDCQPVRLVEYPAALTALCAGTLNNDAHLETNHLEDKEIPAFQMVGDSTEGALLIAAAKTGILTEVTLKAYPRVDEIPFDSIRKRMVTIHLFTDQNHSTPSFNTDHLGSGHLVVVKGAPDIILDQCNSILQINNQETLPLTPVNRQAILTANDEMTQNALRVLALAYRIIPPLMKGNQKEDLEKDLIFLGLIGMIDPPRPEIQPALDQARQAGIRTLMITGDYPNTAKAIAQQICLTKSDPRVITGPEINQMDDDTLQSEVMKTSICARVSPEHKMRIVDALRKNGQVVAMTGDGVNDAPAIKRADIGIAMGISGTDVAKESADMVLMDDNYATIVSAIEQGRIIYSNIRKFVYYLLSCNLAEIATLFIATLLGWSAPLTALQLLWLNLVTDGTPALALGTEKGDPDIMQQKPRPSKQPIINKSMQIGILIQTVAITAVTLSAYWIGRFTDPIHIQYAETMTFVTLSCSELIRAFTARSEFYPILKIGVLRNRYMNLAVISSFLLIMAVIYVPFLRNVFNTTSLGWQQWEAIIPLILIPSIAAEIPKYVNSHHKR
jgi:P-type Ca2+ transporter type 2C